MPFELRMAVRYLTTRRRQGLVTLVTLLCTAGVFVGVAALVLALALMTGVQVDIRSRLLASSAHVEVRHQWGAEPFSAEEAEAVLAAAMRHPDVVAAAPFAEAPALLRSRQVPSGRQAWVVAIDPSREDAVTGLAHATPDLAWARLLAEGSAVAPSDVDDEDAGPMTDDELAAEELPSVLLGLDLAMSLGVSTGDVVHLVSAAPDLSALGVIPTGKSRALRVAGLLQTGVRELDQLRAVVTLARWRPAGEPVVDGVHLAVREPLLSARIASELSDELPRELLVTDWTTTFSRLFAAFRWEKLLMSFALGLIGVVAGFNIFTILTMNVMARVVDVGVLSALGATRSVVTRIFTWMGLAIGVAGTVVGVGLGSLAAWLLDRYHVIGLDPSVYMVDHVSFRVEAADLVLVSAGMVIVSLLATIVPARVAAALEPLSALRSG